MGVVIDVAHGVMNPDEAVKEIMLHIKNETNYEE